ncbi:hypothetical protein Vafri_2933 [Volvox africanus]|uniref:Uncharacterized protein n=1 Tax=Volvox africanus TaxID=51714 RepID=A0A8J4ASJ5_9CHLO|nr:hypothetical protein Vafri_2933 [Volvox africanus]
MRMRRFTSPPRPSPREPQNMDGRSSRCLAAARMAASISGATPSPSVSATKPMRRPASGRLPPWSDSAGNSPAAKSTVGWPLEVASCESAPCKCNKKITYLRVHEHLQSGEALARGASGQLGPCSLSPMPAIATYNEVIGAAFPRFLPQLSWPVFSLPPPPSALSLSVPAASCDCQLPEPNVRRRNTCSILHQRCKPLLSSKCSAMQNLSKGSCCQVVIWCHR